MAVDTATALRAYGQAAAGKPGATAGAASLNGDDFASLVTGAVTDAEAKLRTAEQAAAQGVTGAGLGRGRRDRRVGCGAYAGDRRRRAR